MVRCPRCGTLQLQDLRTWTYAYTETLIIEGVEKDVDRHICPVCIFEGAEEEDHRIWEH